MKDTEEAKSLKTSPNTSIFSEKKRSAVADYVGILTPIIGFISTTALFLWGILGITLFQYVLFFIGITVLIIFSVQLITIGKLLNNLEVLFKREQRFQELLRKEEEREKIKEKYKDVGFEELEGVCEFHYDDQARIKRDLINKVTKSVYATHLIDIEIPKPMEKEDDYNYFLANKEALERIKKYEGDGIHRIFLITEEVLNDKSFCDEIRSLIDEHINVPFDVKLALYQNLSEPVSFDFAIYDGEFVFRLGLNSYRGKYSNPRGYFSPSLVDIYQKRWKILSQIVLNPKNFGRHTIDLIIICKRKYLCRK